MALNVVKLGLISKCFALVVSLLTNPLIQ